MQRTKILAVSFELFLKYGIKSVSIDDISRSLGISKKTFYEYYTNKKELVKTVIEYFVEQETEDLNEIAKTTDNAIEEMLGVAKYILNFLKDMSPSLVYDLKKYYGESWKIIEHKHMTNVQEQIKTNLIRGKKDGLYKESIDDDIISRLYVAQAMTITNEDIFPTKDFVRTKLFEELVVYHLYGIVSDKGRKYIKKSQLNA